MMTTEPGDIGHVTVRIDLAHWRQHFEWTANNLSSFETMPKLTHDKFSFELWWMALFRHLDHNLAAAVQEIARAIFHQLIRDQDLIPEVIITFEDPHTTISYDENIKIIRDMGTRFQECLYSSLGDRSKLRSFLGDLVDDLTEIVQKYVMCNLTDYVYYLSRFASSKLQTAENVYTAADYADSSAILDRWECLSRLDMVRVIPLLALHANEIEELQKAFDNHPVTFEQIIQWVEREYERKGYK